MSSLPPLTERQAFLVLNAVPGLGPLGRTRLLAAAGGEPCRVLSDRASLQRLLQRHFNEGDATGGDIIGREINGRDASPRRPDGSESRPCLNAKRVDDPIGHPLPPFDLAQEERAMAQAGIDYLTPSDAAYPQLLREIPDPPICLYRQGRHDLRQPCLAVIGSRRTTHYGLAIARQLAADLALSGYCIVSGLARGIDTAAHEGALAAGGRTVAVLGTGLDTIYPPENLELSRRIAETGAVLSEFRLGSPATKQSFPMRNRIVSGMSDAIIVVESDVDGGAMITARLAGEQGRTVFAVPGRIDQPTSAGCHQLIRDGAALVTCVDDILSELSHFPALRPQRAGRANLPAAASLSAGLMMLELRRLIAKRLDGAYEACG